MEQAKGSGIINGIDTAVWDPQTDPMIVEHYAIKQEAAGKLANKEALCQRFGLPANKPLISFIGRLVVEKGADVIPAGLKQSFEEYPGQFSFLVLGTGDKDIELHLADLSILYPENCFVYIGYDEALAHLIYAGSDFMLMPSRVEPCGLNQLYSLRYGTMPMVRSTGGLKDTVIDFGDDGGYGIRFETVTAEDISYSITRANVLYENDFHLQTLRKVMMALDFSWGRSAAAYTDLYNSLNPIIS